MHTKQELDARMQEAGIQPLKKLGQNFLLNPNIVDAIVTHVKALSPSAVVEIGPGLGALTDELIVSFPSSVTLVEIDSGLVEFWKKRAPLVQIIHSDAMSVQWVNLGIPDGACLVSNLPYSIAASLVMEITLQAGQPFSSMVLMMQKEVASRIQAAPNAEDYGIPSVVVQTFWTIAKLVDAGPQDFYPVPNVGSRVITLKQKTSTLARQGYVEFVKQAFSQRRKKLNSNLKNSYPKAKIDEAFEKLGLSDSARAQELSPTQFEEFYRLISV
ncbi:MAG: ribosomal RNA small subunit methyltransferase A [Oligoflexia bacterium]|nr:ribosomal RNA small subunit methyltransferase A [Oligoflexia bacterium]